METEAASISLASAIVIALASSAVTAIIAGMLAWRAKAKAVDRGWLTFASERYRVERDDSDPDMRVFDEASPSRSREGYRGPRDWRDDVL